MRLIPYVRRSEVPSRFWHQTPSLFEDLFNSFPFFHSMREEEDGWLPPVDIIEKDGKLIFRAELPGMEEKDIDLKLEGNILTLKGERKLEKNDKKDSYHRIESHYGCFTRSYILPDTADADKIKAEYKNGVLTVTVPQKPELRPREIPVSTN